MKIKKVTCTFELKITTDLNENQIKERIHNVLNDFHCENSESSSYFDPDEVQEADIISVEILVKN